MTREEKQFLKESNAIEGVIDKESYAQAAVAWRYLKKQSELNLNVILKTHKLLMLNQPIADYERGYLRKVAIYIGGREGLAHYKLEGALKDWCEDVMVSIKAPSFTLAEMNIKDDHIRYEKIHPFVDGNGRTGRMFMNWQRLKANLPILVIHTGLEQQEYYKWFY